MVRIAGSDARRDTAGVNDERRVAAAVVVVVRLTTVVERGDVLAAVGRRGAADVAATPRDGDGDGRARALGDASGVVRAAGGVAAVPTLRAVFMSSSFFRRSAAASAGVNAAGTGDDSDRLFAAAPFTRDAGVRGAGPPAGERGRARASSLTNSGRTIMP